jgi:hypothetical protein
MARRAGKGARLIARSSRNKQNAGHSSMLSTAQHDHPQRIGLSFPAASRGIEFLADFVIQTPDSRV